MADSPKDRALDDDRTGIDRRTFLQQGGRAAVRRSRNVEEAVIVEIDDDQPRRGSAVRAQRGRALESPVGVNIVKHDATRCFCLGCLTTGNHHQTNRHGNKDA